MTRLRAGACYSGVTNRVAIRAARAFSWVPKRLSKVACFSGLRRCHSSIIFSAVPISTLAWVSLKVSVTLESGVGVKRLCQAV